MVTASESMAIDAMLRLLADAACEHAIFLIDPQGRIIWWSRGAERVFGVTATEAIGAHFAEIFTTEDRAAGIDLLERSIAAAGAISEDDRWHVRGDGSRFWSSGAVVPLHDEQGNLIGFGKILRDRTDLKEQLELARNQLQQMREREQSIDTAIARLSHELRNLFAGIATGLHLLQTRPLREVSELMRDQLDMLTRLNEDLLDVKRLARNKFKLITQPVALERCVTQVVSTMQERLVRGGLTLEVLAPAASVLVQADPVRMNQMLANVIDNAIKYTPAGGRIWVKCTVDEHDAMIHVEDTGRGIPADRLTHIFELFTQVDCGVNGAGLGIGLALVRELAEAHGGSVQAASKGLGLGSEFTLRIPRARDQQTPA
jgi:two-component system CheB/CheR fusion protein